MRLQSPAFLHIVTIATRTLEVEARSEACGYVSGELRGGELAAYLASLLLEGGKLLDSSLKVGLK